jgi:BirA family biotin operon repressor/biotin-[acetyl-CoA-carboxylase] ligase
MTEPLAHLPWNARALWERLRGVLPGIDVEILARCDSTNTRLIERAREAGGDPEAPITHPGCLDANEPLAATPRGRRGGDVEPRLLVAEYQTQGRGRLGRTWVAQPGASLTFSLALALAPRDWSGLSLAAGLAIAQALEPQPPAGGTPRIVLKWPNDLYLASRGPGGERSARKLGGILVETVNVGRQRMCVVGVGINIAPVTLPPDHEAVACLQELRPGVRAPQALAEVAVPLARALLAFEREGFTPLVPGYARRDWLLEQPLLATTNGNPHGLAGVAEGIDARGALLLRTGGRVERIVSGEVSVRPAARGAA